MGYGDMGSIMLWWYVAPPYRVAEDVNTPFACLTDTQSVASARCKWTRAFCVPRYYIFPSTLSHSLLCVSFFHRELFSIHHFLLDRFPLRIVGASLSLSLWHLQFPGTYVFFYSLPLSSLWFTRQLALLCGEYASSFRLQTNLKDVGKENQIDGEMATIKKSGLTFAIVYDVTSLYVRVLREHSHLASRSVYVFVVLSHVVGGGGGSLPKTRGGTKNYFKKKWLARFPRDGRDCLFAPSPSSARLVVSCMCFLSLTLIIKPFWKKTKQTHQRLENLSVLIIADAIPSKKRGAV